MEHRSEVKHGLPFHDLNQSSLDLIKSFMRTFDLLGSNNKIPEFNWQEIFNIEHIYQKWYSELSKKPNNISQAQIDLFQDYKELCHRVQEMMQGKKVEPLFETNEKDRRFKHPSWKDSAPFFFFQQYYFLLEKHSIQFLENNPSSDPKIAKQISFFTKQYLNAIAPSNFVMTNPEVLQRTISSKGENLVQGFKNLLDDYNRGHGHWTFQMTDTKAFQIGKNIAITPGKVIYQNSLIQLIQYLPTTDEVYQKPLLIVPPWINKFYILDLRERNSFVKWIVDQGFTVFMISWVNPDQSFRGISFEDYLFQGFIPALETAIEVTNQESINALGFCIGGTLLATALAYLQATGDTRVASASFLTTLIDFQDPGEIEVFIDEEQISTLEKEMDAEGFLDGRMLGNTFNLLRPNELFWPYYIKNYLCGENPYSFDLLYWNSDATNLPLQMVSDFVRKFYMGNRLCKKGGFILKGTLLDINTINTPSYFFSAEQDHIAPWQSTFKGAKYFQGPVTFVLGDSGHVAGVINPPVQEKYSYSISEWDIKHFNDPEEWLKNSKELSGSWWEHWADWLKTYSGAMETSRIPGEGKFKVIQEAPGDYVKRRI